MIWFSQLVRQVQVKHILLLHLHQALKNKQVKKIILTRPAIEAGESLGFLPGDMKEKLDPYLQPLYDALRDMLPTQKFLVIP